jgi:hypothetical protein
MLTSQGSGIAHAAPSSRECAWTPVVTPFGERAAHDLLHELIERLLAELSRDRPPGKTLVCDGCYQTRPAAGFRLCRCRLLCADCAAKQD